jgi:signal transduction histidine kinase
MTQGRRRGTFGAMTFFRARGFDLLLALGVGTFAQVEVWTEHLHPLWVACPVALAQGTLLVWRRQAPIAVALAAFGLLLAETAAGVSLHTPVYPILLVMLFVYGAGSYAPWPRTLIGLAVPLVAMWASMALAVAHGDNYTPVGDVIFVSVLVVTPWLVGRAMYGRVQETRELAIRADRAASDERARIARELHDVISHSVSVMVVQAGAAEEVMKTDAERAVEPLRAIQETGRQALVELTRLVGLLRDDSEELGLSPQPGLEALETLVGKVRDAGLPVELRIEGQPRQVPLGVGLSAYRVVQEALTNALKHAGDARATVLLRYDPGAVELEIADDGNGSGNGHGGGHGLAGMRERVSVFGGEFAAGPRAGGGFLVEVRLPTEPA